MVYRRTTVVIVLLVSLGALVVLILVGPAGPFWLLLVALAGLVMFQAVLHFVFLGTSNFFPAKRFVAHERLEVPASNNVGSTIAAVLAEQGFKNITTDEPHGIILGRSGFSLFGGWQGLRVQIGVAGRVARINLEHGPISPPVLFEFYVDHTALFDVKRELVRRLGGRSPKKHLTLDF
ncbi:MAG: hypothetical protein HY420_02650 [Candidatus Kerfeldbacteria bacterium]|nr:hypothetical protein [Candidatus Kerfeldbacteria bacterium]